MISDTAQYIMVV